MGNRRGFGCKCPASLKSFDWGGSAIEVASWLLAFLSGLMSGLAVPQSIESRVEENCKGNHGNAPSDCKGDIRVESPGHGWKSKHHGWTSRYEEGTQVLVHDCMLALSVTQIGGSTAK